MNGQKVRVCQTAVDPLPEGIDSYLVEVPLFKTKSKKQSRFFSFISFIDGFKNNIKGFYGFIRGGAKEKEAFKDRMSEEQRLKAIVASKKAAKAAEAQAAK